MPSNNFIDANDFLRGKENIGGTVYDDNKHKMPLILASKNYNKMKKLHHIRNIYMHKDPPLFVKFERFGKNFD